jgi:hypothetical protein
MSQIEIYQQILNETVTPDMDVLDVLPRAVVLHTHSIALAESVVFEDIKPSAGSSRVALAPLTRTHLAALLSTGWGRRGEAPWSPN